MALLNCARAMSAAALVGVVTMAAVGAGCSYEKRPARTQAQLLALREKGDAAFAESTNVILGKVLARTKGMYDEYAAGRRKEPPVVDILIISGGGDWGAFGAGFLKGWRTVPAGSPGAMPDFSAVTGVSTGALIAPFAFIGDAEALERVEHLYRNPKPDWVKKRGLLYFLPNNISLAKVPGLERELKANVTRDLVERIAERGKDGRLLAVNTTNVDDGTPRVFDLGEEARRALETDDYTRLNDVILASAGIPGAFPFRVIDDEMYVDGGVTGNIIYGGRIAEKESLAARWQAAYPGLPIPKTRFWVVFNNQLRPLPTVTEPNWPSVVARSLETATRSSTLTAIRHLYAMSEISRLKRGAEIEVRVVSIPGDWAPPKPGAFVKETMNSLADLGERMGKDPSSWKTESP